MTNHEYLAGEVTIYLLNKGGDFVNGKNVALATVLTAECPKHSSNVKSGKHVKLTLHGWARSGEVRPTSHQLSHRTTRQPRPLDVYIYTCQGVETIKI